MAPRDIRDTYYMMLTRHELEEVQELFRTRHLNIQLRYPDMLWDGTEFPVPTYPRRWMPDPAIPPLLNAAEAQEYTASHTSK